MPLTDETSDRDAPSTEMVVLVHGLGAIPLWMMSLELRLRNDGFNTLNWGYLSVWGSIEWHARSLRKRIESLREDAGVERISLVTHSLGGIVTRCMLADEPVDDLGRIVMLCPPHRGARLATMASMGFGWFSKPLAQIADRDDSFVNQLAAPEGVDIGIIAGGSDWLVAVENTHLPTAVDHRVVPYGHNRILFQSDVAELVTTFLRQGRFHQGEDTREIEQPTTGPS